LSAGRACRADRQHIGSGLAFAALPGAGVFLSGRPYNWGMIRTARPHRCFCCQTAVATREVPDRDGRLIPLCRRCPSPLEIDAAARKISWAWSDTERATRYYGCTSDQVRQRAGRTVCYDRVYEVVGD